MTDSAQHLAEVLGIRTRVQPQDRGDICRMAIAEIESLRGLLYSRPVFSIKGAGLDIELAISEASDFEVIDKILDRVKAHIAKEKDVS